MNPWAGATMVYVGYCSSDAWWGDTEAWGLQFRGQAIVAAVLQDMLQNRGLRPGAGARLLFGGCSAGARGAMAHLDNVAAALEGVQVRGFLDSGIWMDAEPADANVPSLMEETQQVFAFVDPRPLIPAACAAMYPGAEGWHCLYGQYRMPFVETPYFANEGAQACLCAAAALAGLLRRRRPRWRLAVADARPLLSQRNSIRSRLSTTTPAKSRTSTTKWCERAGGPLTHASLWPTRVGFGTPFSQPLSIMGCARIPCRRGQTPSSSRCARRCCRCPPRRSRRAGCSRRRACSTA